MSSILQSPWDSLSEHDNPVSQEAYVTWWGVGVKQASEQMNKVIRIVRTAIRIIAW